MQKKRKEKNPVRLSYKISAWMSVAAMTAAAHGCDSNTSKRHKLAPPLALMIF